MNKNLLFVFFFFVSINFAAAKRYYVSVNGNDNNSGTIEEPLATVNKAVSLMESGDKCYVRQGIYYESVVIDEKDNIQILAYNGEHVLFDGTQKIENNWQLHQGAIYKTQLENDVWQLFVDRKEVVMARWPNAQFDDFSVFDNENHWALGDPDNSSTKHEIIVPFTNDHGEEIDLEKSGIDATGAIAILNNSSFRTWARRVSSHNGNTIYFPQTPSSAYKTKHHHSFLEGKLELLDSENEWFYKKDTKTLYLWAPNGVNPNNLSIHGKRQTYSFSVENSSNIIIKGIYFFSSTFTINNSNNCGIDACYFLYPSCSKRMIGDLSYQEGSYVDAQSVGAFVKNSYFAYTDGPGLVFFSDNGTVENNYFYFIDYTCAEGDNLQPGINMNRCTNVTFKKNTVHKLGSSAMLDPGNKALLMLNDLYENGMIQSDGAMIQCMRQQQVEIEICYNWLHDTKKYGARFDGGGYTWDEPGFRHGTMHHNVAWRVKSGFIAKGNHHDIYNNTAFDCDGGKNKSDIAILYGSDFGPNDSTVTRNNAANTICGERSISTSVPIPGYYDHCWNGLDTGKNLKDLLTAVPSYDNVEDYDKTVLDFRPKSGTALVDAGEAYTSRWVNTVEAEVVGTSIDIGAYEHNGTNWKAGISWSVDSLEHIFETEVLSLDNSGTGYHVNEQSLNLLQLSTYPNPFNKDLTINYSMLHNAYVDLSVYNLQGKLIEVIERANKVSGNYSFTWLPTQLKSGLYIVSFTSNGETKREICVYNKLK